MRGECEHAQRFHTPEKGLEVRMSFYLRPLTVIQSGAPQFLVLQPEAERFDQMQARAGVGAQPHDVAGVGRNLGLIEHDMKHVSAAFGTGMSWCFIPDCI